MNPRILTAIIAGSIAALALIALTVLTIIALSTRHEPGVFFALYVWAAITFLTTASAAAVAVTAWYNRPAADLDLETP